MAPGDRAWACMKVDAGYADFCERGSQEGWVTEFFGGNWETSEKAKEAQPQRPSERSSECVMKRQSSTGASRQDGEGYVSSGEIDFSAFRWYPKR